MYKTPPATSTGWVTRPVYVFEKAQGTVSSTFCGRVVERATIIIQPDHGDSFSVARYDRKIWRLYPPEIFPQLSAKRWIKEGDTVYGDQNSKLILPLEHPFMFDADKPLDTY